MKVSGKNVLVQILKDEDWNNFGCATSATLEFTTEFIETSEVGAGTYATYKPSKISFTGSLEGFTTLDGSILSLAYFRSLQLAGAIFKMKFSRVVGSDEFIESYNFYVSACSDTTTFPGLNTYSISLQGTGASEDIINPDDPTPTPVPFKYGWTELDTTSGIPAESDYLDSVDDAITAGKYINDSAASATSNVSVSFAGIGGDKTVDIWLLTLQAINDADPGVDDFFYSGQFVNIPGASPAGWYLLAGLENWQLSSTPDDFPSFAVPPSTTSDIFYIGADYTDLKAHVQTLMPAGYKGLTGGEFIDSTLNVNLEDDAQGLLVRFVRLDLAANDFNYYSVFGDAIQQNVPLGGLWKQVRTGSYLYLYTTWQTAFANKVIFSR